MMSDETRRKRGKERANLEAFKRDLYGPETCFGAFVEDVEDEMATSGSSYRAGADSEWDGLREGGHQGLVRRKLLEGAGGGEGRDGALECNCE